MALHQRALQRSRLFGRLHARGQDVELRRGFEHAFGKDHEKIGLNALPIHLAQAVNRGLHGHALDVKNQGVPQ